MTSKKNQETPTKQTVADFPLLKEQWHPTKNGTHLPNEVTVGSSRKVWWKCSNGLDHEWEAVVHKRTSRGDGCPYCSGQKLSKSNSLATLHPDLASQLHPTKNGELSAETLIAGSHKKVWWQCSKISDHKWEAVVHKRTSRGNGCPYCSGQKLSKSNSLATLYPDIALQFHPTKNGTITARQVLGGSSKKYWWKCPKGPDHEWQASVQKRTSSGRNCPCCAGKQLSVTNSLLSLHPQIALQFHPVKNEKTTVNQLLAGTHKKIWWKCPKGSDHEWEASVVSRAYGRGCPCCVRLKLSITNSLATLHPDIALQFHPTKNDTITADQVLGGSSKKYWWKCLKGPDHEWEATVHQRTSSGSGCPCCSGLKLSATNSLATLYPDIALEFDPIKNGKMTPAEVISGSDTKYWWKCPKGPDHEWQAAASSRTRGGNGCPCCAGLKPSTTNSLATLHPNVALELHPIKNGKLSAENLIAGSHKKVWWQCSKNPFHEWETSVQSRTQSRGGTGCPICNSGFTVELLRNFVKSLINHIEFFTPAERYMIFQQAGILKCTGRAKDLIKAITTGRFPHEELERFSAGRDSLADQFINGEINSCETLADSLDRDDINQVTVNLEENPLEILLDAESDLPIINTHQSLESIDRAVQLVSMDSEAIEFLLASKTTQLWQHAFQNKIQAREQALSFNGTEYSERVKNRFLADLDAAENLKLPQNYSFRVKGKLTQPNLMQLLIASQLKHRTGLGNWSGTGTGKTLSAILASRAINARLTIVCCPNPVVGSSKTGRGWADEIVSIFPDSKVQIKTLSPEWQAQDTHKYLIINYEQLQKSDAHALIRKLIDQSSIDMIIIDEIHYAKQRKKENLSLRRELLTALITLARKQNPNLRVLGLSATPIINNLHEGKSLLEMITGVQYPELETKATIPNCHKLHQQLVIHGYRWRHNYAQEFLEKRIEIDCSQYVDKIRSLGKNASPHTIDELLTKARLPMIRENCLPGKKTLIYTHYIEGITEQLASALRADGHVVGFYTGEDKTGLKPFLEGNVNVLIGSSAIATGIDGLQNVCDQLIVNILPWTSSEYEQLTGRIARQGQQSNSVTIVLPITYANINGIRWSWEESKLSRIKWKKDVASAAVDGVIPEGHLQTPEQTTKHLLDWLERLSTGSVNMVERSPLLLAPFADNPPEEVRRLAKYGDLSRLNQLWNVSLSATTHTRLKENPEEWHHYHQLYRSARESWTVIPYEEMIHWCRERTGFKYKIGDFGCGEAKLAEAINGTHTIYSFDHIAINDNVTACDMTQVPLGDELLDVALFSLSLMGKNFPDYLKEAHRTLRLDGILIIFEPTSRFIDDQGINHSSQFAKDLEQFGFSGGTVETLGLFTRIQAIKRFKKPRSDITISFKKY
ncbi:MAG: DEAD/DEAH box helicase family protein [Rhabdochlamydiaceae bacterium]|nr:DEAD/DEAH box helicase family protein [Rhabdochlamydiaceae bacterium]